MARFGTLILGLVLAVTIPGTAHAEGKGQGKAGAPGQQVSAAAKSGLQGKELAAFVHTLNANGIPENGPQAEAISGVVQQALQAGLRGPQLAAVVHEALKAQGKGPLAAKGMKDGFPDKPGKSQKVGYPAQEFGGGPGKGGVPCPGNCKPGGGGRGKGK